MSQMIRDILQKIDFEPQLVDEIISLGRLRKIEADQVLVSPEMPGSEIPIVMSGLLKVMRQNPDGNEIFLYYLEGGETCAMSLNCCLEGKKAAFKVVSEEASLLWMIPTYCMDGWVTKYLTFRRFVFASYQLRFDELLTSIDNVVFHKMDERIYSYLLDTKQAKGSFEIHKTHEQIAKELNTSRVVVSRLLKKLEKEEKIAQYRNKIEVL